MSKVPTSVSVVVIGRNEGTRLERCLTSVARMHCEGLQAEVIYVDSGSTDDSVATARRMGANTIALTAGKTTAALGRNVGWQRARGDFIMFLDGDTILDARFVSEALREFQPKTGIIWGHRRELYPSATVYQRVLDLDWIYKCGESSFCGGDALFRRDVLEQTKGFDPDLIAGEEPELCQRVLALGYVIEHIDRAMTGHDLNITRFSQYWRRATRAGHAYAEVAEQSILKSKPFWRQECRRNSFQAVTFVMTTALVTCMTYAFASVWPLIVWSAALCIVVSRTAWKARWKTSDWAVLLLYGFHSHVQHLPIALGQLRYHLNRRRGRRAALVEYK